MMQRTATENAACLRRICKRFDEPKIEKLLSLVTRFACDIGQLARRFGSEFHLRSSPSAYSGFVNISRPAEYFTACYTVLKRPNKVETTVHGCNLAFSLDSTVSLPRYWSFLRSISPASLFTSLSIFGWSDLLQILRRQAAFSFAVLCITMFNNGNRTEWSPIRSVIIRVMNKIGRRRSGSPIC